MIIVQNGNDSGGGSLRSAIDIANTSSDKFTIISFAISVDEISLISNITVSSNIKIINKLKRKIKIIVTSAPPLTSHFVVTTADFFVIRGVELTGATNAAIQGNSNPLFLDNAIVCGNIGGGGIVTQGNLTLTHSRVNNNTNTILISGNTFGGGINVGGNSTVIDSQIYENKCTNGFTGFGGGIYVNGDSLLKCSKIYNNCDDNFENKGGGIYVNGNSIIENSQIYGNRCIGDPSHGTCFGGGC